MAARDPATVQRGRQSKVVVDVTGSAGHVGMAIGEREPCCAVVKCRRRPTYRRMTYRTVPYRKLRARRRVHRIIRLLPGSQMAARGTATVQSGRQIIIIIDVARSAGHAGMSIGEWEPCYAVIKGRPSPTIHCVTRAAIRDRKKRWRRGVRGIRGLLPSGQMAS
jgi:hypothetical protein